MQLVFQFNRSIVFGIKKEFILWFLAGSFTLNMPEVVWWSVLIPPPPSVSLSSKDQAEMDPADMEDVEEVEEEETGEDENSKGLSLCKDATVQRVCVLKCV